MRMAFVGCLTGLLMALDAGQGLADNAAPDTAPLCLVRTDQSEVPVSLDDLQSLPRHEITTNTIWTEGEQVFTGVRLWDFIQHFGIVDGTLELTARNEYFIEIPVSDITPDFGLIAYLRNGDPMPRRGKGPLWLVFDYDSDPAFRQETIYALSIWQLDRIAVAP